jgi:hypothetical protein
VSGVNIELLKLTQEFRERHWTKRERKHLLNALTIIRGCLCRFLEEIAYSGLIRPPNQGRAARGGETAE